MSPPGRSRRDTCLNASLRPPQLGRRRAAPKTQRAHGRGAHVLPLLLPGCAGLACRRLRDLPTPFHRLPPE